MEIALSSDQTTPGILVRRLRPSLRVERSLNENSKASSVNLAVV